MQTLIKWPGGKTSEFEIIKKFLPEYSRYIEPFFGGGAVFFNMPPQKAIINDISANLMQFYRFLQTKNTIFENYLYAIDREWNHLKTLALREATDLLPLYLRFRKDETFALTFEKTISDRCIRTADTLAASSAIIMHPQSFLRELTRMLTNKIFGTRKNEIKHEQNLAEQDLIENMVTGFTAGYYMYLREQLNNSEKFTVPSVAQEYKIALFYFVREFCYGSMFRYNKSGDFNIPYGGIAYNDKDFRKKIDLLFSEETNVYLKDAEIRCCDFEQVLNDAQTDDFIFLDPPYDTNFSDYENRSFDETDQARLAKCLHNTPAKFLLIIKNTPLITNLYKNNGYRIYAFDNRYSYCVKGRNDRNAVHLIITNYDQDKIS